MVNYTCPTCLKEFDKKFNFDSHTKKKKNPCKPVLQEFAGICKNLQEFAENPPTDGKTGGKTGGNIRNIQQSDDKSEQITNNKNNKTEKVHICTFCDKTYSSIYTLDRHVSNSCKVKKNIDIENNKKIEIQNKQIEEQSKQIQELIKIVDKLKNKSGKTQNINHIVVNNTNNTNNTNTNNINTNTNNINILPYGSETKVNLLSVLEQLANHKDMLMLIPNMAKHIYIDTPENKNFRIVDLSRNKCEYYNGEKWVTGKTDDKIIKMFENVNNVLTGPFDKENLIKTLKFIESNKELKEKTKWINFSKGYCMSLWDETDPENIENKKKIINELKYIFFNYKDQILKIDL